MIGVEMGSLCRGMYSLWTLTIWVDSPGEGTYLSVDNAFHWVLFV